jgi:hypothetical protein
MPRKPCVSLRHRLRPRVGRQVELFQKPRKPAVSTNRMEKRFDRQQIYEVCFVFNRFIKALERQIEISHPNCGETFCEGRHVMPTREFMKPLDTFAGSR